MHGLIHWDVGEGGLLLARRYRCVGCPGWCARYILAAAVLPSWHAGLATDVVVLASVFFRLLGVLWVA